MALTPDGKQLFIAAALQGEVKVVDPVAGTALNSIRTTGSPRRLSFSADGHTVVANESGWVDFIK